MSLPTFLGSGGPIEQEVNQSKQTPKLGLKLGLRVRVRDWNCGTHPQNLREIEADES
jgi:hypothetical protein